MRYIAKYIFEQRAWFVLEEGKDYSDSDQIAMHIYGDTSRAERFAKGLALLLNQHQYLFAFLDQIP